ncbi:hypothetical protein [Nocardia sp. NPDC051832]|uniref:hypothetical protein n=1 Tax=Nocardia sp. NPDC051832 TaxID=3155673 RepID=UPI0034247DAB
MKWPSWIRDMQASQRAHEQRMQRAAGVDAVKLVCRRDVWDQLDLWQISGGHRPSEWVSPGLVRRIGDDMVEVPLSGLNVVALLRSTRRHLRAAEALQAGTRTVAHRVYDQIAQVIDAEATPGAPLPAIVVDDELVAATQ